MTNVEKVILGIIVALVAVLGSGKLSDDRSVAELGFRAATPIEKSMLIGYDSGFENFNYESGADAGYYSLMQAIIRDRVSNATAALENKVNVPVIRKVEHKGPFCEYVQLIHQEESLIVRRNDKISFGHPALVSNQFRSLFGKTMEEHCNGVKVVEPTPEPEVAKPVPSPAVLDDEPALPLAMYDELIAAAGNCRRANHRLIELTNERRSLTQSQYDEVYQIIVECKMDKLSAKLNEM